MLVPQMRGERGKLLVRSGPQRGGLTNATTSEHDDTVPALRILTSAYHPACNR